MPVGDAAEPACPGEVSVTAAFEMPTAASELLSKTDPPLEDASIVATAARARPTRARVELVAERLRVKMDGTPHAWGKRSAMGRGGQPRTSGCGCRARGVRQPRKRHAS